MWTPSNLFYLWPPRSLFGSDWSCWYVTIDNVHVRRLCAGVLFAIAIWTARDYRRPPPHQQQSMRIEQLTIDPVASARKHLEQLSQERKQYVSQRLLRSRRGRTGGDLGSEKLRQSTDNSGTEEVASERNSHGCLAATGIDS